MKRLFCLLLLICSLAIAVPSFARQKQTATQKIMQKQRKDMAKQAKAQKKAQRKQQKEIRKRQQGRTVSGGL